jgi:hypothetical protein
LAIRRRKSCFESACTPSTFFQIIIFCDDAPLTIQYVFEDIMFIVMDMMKVERRWRSHHKYPHRKWIIDGYRPEDYPDDWLATVCGRCHPATDKQNGEFKEPRAPSS